MSGDKGVSRDSAEGPNELGVRLRRTREATGKSLKEFAPRVGVSPNTLAGYELSKQLPTVEFLGRFAILTGANYAELSMLLAAESPSAPKTSIAILLAAVERMASTGQRGLRESPVPFNHSAGVERLSDLRDYLAGFFEGELDMPPEKAAEKADQFIGMYVVWLERHRVDTLLREKESTS